MVEVQVAGLPCFVSDTVTRDVCILPLVKYLPIDKGTRVWIDAIRRSDFFRKNVKRNVVKEGFDIKRSASWLTDFYVKLTN